jgi:hypothetical protein
MLKRRSINLHSETQRITRQNISAVCSSDSVVVRPRNGWERNQCATATETEVGRGGGGERH